MELTEFAAELSELSLLKQYSRNNIRPFPTCLHVLSGHDRSRHSSEQHPKEVNSESSNYCPFLSWNFRPPGSKLLRCGNDTLLQC